MMPNYHYGCSDCKGLQNSANCSPASVVSVKSSMPVPPTTPSSVAHEVGIGDQRHAQFAGLITLALLRVWVVADRQ